jgi:hypothetical protein
LDRQPLGGELEVGPLQSDDLTATHPGLRGEVQCRRQAPKAFAAGWTAAGRTASSCTPRRSTDEVVGGAGGSTARSARPAARWSRRCDRSAVARFGRFVAVVSCSLRRRRRRRTRCPLGRP